MPLGNEGGCEKEGCQQVCREWFWWYRLHGEVQHVGGLTQSLGRVGRMRREEVVGWQMW